MWHGPNEEERSTNSIITLLVGVLHRDTKLNTDGFALGNLDLIQTAKQEESFRIISEIGFWVLPGMLGSLLVSLNYGLSKISYL
ncbi:hypothetical protein SLA2020_236460 [Shorea laevis]